MPNESNHRIDYIEFPTTDIAATKAGWKEAKIKASGGTIVKPIFSFPGGRRFHFTDPNGNELSVWSA